MKYTKSILIILLILTASLLVGFGIQQDMHTYSRHRWFEGHSEDVIDDVMENYVYPGVSAEATEDLLGTGSDNANELKERILHSFCAENGQTERETDYTVLIYPISNPPQDSDNLPNSYFVVIHDGTTVLKTALIHSLT